MLYPKEQFEKEIEQISKNFSDKKVECLLKDLSDCIVFSCIFAGNQKVFCEDIQIEKKSDDCYEIISNLKNVKKENISDAKKYSLISYDKTLELTVLTSKNYFSFTKSNDIDTYYYNSEYFFDELGNFIRKCGLRHEKLNVKQDIVETSLGTIDSDLFISETYEKKSSMNVITFKLPSVDKKTENIYLKYTLKGDMPYMCQTRDKFKKIPYLEVLGMNLLSTLLSEQFDDEIPLRIEDENFFNRLINSSVQFYKKVNNKSKIKQAK